MQEKIVFFEELKSAYYKILKKYVSDGFTLYFFKSSDSFVNKKNIKKFIEEGKLIDAGRIIYKPLLWHWSARYAHENLDHLFDKTCASSRSIKVMVNLLNSPAIVDMYKKAFLEELQKIYEIQLKIIDITSNKMADIYFYPKDNFEIHCDDLSLLKNANILRLRNIYIKSTLRNAFRRFGMLALSGGAPIYRLLKNPMGVSFKRKNPRRFKIGLRLNMPGLFSYNYYAIRFMVDSYELPKKETVFIDEYGGIYEEECRKRGYNYINSGKIGEALSFNMFWKYIKEYYPALIKCIFLSFNEKQSVLETSIRIFPAYVQWNRLLSNYSIDNLVNILIPEGIGGNILLAQNNVKTWLIYPDNSAGDYATGWDEKIPVSIVFSFMHYHYAVVNGDKVRRYFINNKNRIKNYLSIGVFHSQIVDDLQNGKLKSELSPLIKSKKLPVKKMGVFDTSYVDWGFPKIKEGIRFGEDILRLLNEIPDIGVIFREKKFRNFSPQLTPIYEELASHERCLFIQRTENGKIFSPEVIAKSDLVISAPYTSSTTEALAARKKAIYYDISGINIGDKYYFNQFPNMVAHSYEELKKLALYWLYEITDEEFEKYLNTYVKGEIDPYLDCKAIDRLHALLLK